MKRIFRFSSDEADKYILEMENEMERIRYDIANIIPYSIKYFQRIKKMYGKGRERRTEIKSFENIEASSVVLANEKLYINREDGFIGTALKKDEYICDCSDIDEIIIFRKDGTYWITKVADKISIGTDILHVAIFKKNDTRTIYNVIYRDGLHGTSYAKRFYVVGVTRDKEYNVTKGTKGSRILYFTANPNGEAEQVRINLKATANLRKLFLNYDFSKLAIKGRGAVGNQVTKLDIHRVVVTHKGISTLGGMKIWIDTDILRLNTDERGMFLGEFQADDKILVVNKNGTFYTTTYDLSNHYEEGYRLMEKFDPEKIWSAVYFDPEAGFHYLKRFRFEESEKVLSFIGEVPGTELEILSQDRRPRIQIVFGGKNKNRPSEMVEAEEFVGDKSYRAKGKRLTTYQVKKLVEKEPLVLPEDDEDIEDPEDDGSLFNE